MSNEDMVSRAELYFDGALDAAETRAFEAELDRSPDLVAELTALQSTRELLRGFVEDRVEEVDFKDFFSSIQARLPQPAASVAAPVPTTAAGRARAWWGRYWTPVLVTAAAAGGIAFLVGRMSAPDASVVDDDPLVMGGAVQVDEINNEGPKTVLISMPVEDDEESSTVIWLLDDEDTAGDAPADGEDPI